MAVLLPIRFETTICTDTKPDSVQYRLRIYDTEWVGNTLPMDLSNNGFELEWSGDEDDIMSPVITSNLKVFVEVTDQGTESFINALTQFQEERFYVSLERYVDTAYVPYWYGVSMQDLIRRDDTRGCWPYTTEIRFVDGLQRIKETEGEAPSTPGERTNNAEILLYMLKQGAPETMWEDTDDFLFTHVRWYPVDIDWAANAPDSLIWTSTGYDHLFYTWEDDGSKKYKKLFDVLERFVRSYGCRIYHEWGRFNIIHNDTYETQIAAQGPIFNKTYQSPPDPTLTDPGINDPNAQISIRNAVPMENVPTANEYNYNPQYKGLEIEYNIDGTLSVLRPGWQDYITSPVSGSHLIYTGATLDISTTSYYDVINPSGAAFASLRWYITFTTTSSVAYYLNGTGQWTSNPADNVYCSDSKLQGQSYVGVQMTPSFALKTDPVPDNGYITIQAVEVSQNNVDPISDQYASMLTDFSGNVVYYFTDPDADNSSLIYSLEIPIFADTGANTNVPDSVVYDGSSWVPVGNWTETYLDTVGTEYTEFISGQFLGVYNTTNRQKYTGRFWSDTEFGLAIQYEASIYIPTTMTINGGDPYMDVTYSRIGKAPKNLGGGIIGGGRSFIGGPQWPFAVQDRTRWVPGYQDDATYYERNDVIESDGWLLVANKTTNDTAAPVPVGNAEYGIVEEPPPWQSPNDSADAIIYSGHKYTFTKSGWVNAIRVWTPEDAGGTTSIRTVFINATDPDNLIATAIDEPILNSGDSDWTIIAADPTLVSVGTVWYVLIGVYNSAANTTWSFDWEYVGTTNNGTPADGEWNRRSQQDVVRVSYLDEAQDDRSANLLQVITGSVLKFEQADDPTKYWLYSVTGPSTDEGDFYSFPVTLLEELNGGVDTNAVSTLTATIPVPTGTSYKIATNYWPSRPKSWATIEGVLRLNDVDQPAQETNAFGTDILFQEAYVSPDWDFMNYAGGLFAGGGGEIVSAIVSPYTIGDTRFYHKGGPYPTTNSTTWLTIDSVTVSAYRGNYMIDLTVKASQSPTNRLGFYRILVDGVEITAWSHESKDGNVNTPFAENSLLLEWLLAADHTIELQVMAENTQLEITVNEFRYSIKFWRAL